MQADTACSRDRPAMKIRPATPADYPALADLWYNSWQSIGISNETDLDQAGVQKRFASEAAERWHLYMSDRDGQPVGMLALVPEEARIDQLFVAPSYKGLGVGLELLNFAKRKLPDRIVLTTHETNRRARAFYEREGFRLTSSEYDETHLRTRCHYEWCRSTSRTVLSD